LGASTACQRYEHVLELVSTKPPRVIVAVVPFDVTTAASLEFLGGVVQDR